MNDSLRTTRFKVDFYFPTPRGDDSTADKFDRARRAVVERLKAFAASNAIDAGIALRFATNEDAERYAEIGAVGTTERRARRWDEIEKEFEEVVAFARKAGDAAGAFLVVPTIEFVAVECGENWEFVFRDGE